MKIGVITDWTSKNNYGQIMQCWALQYVLKKLGHDPYLIRFLRFDWANLPVHTPSKYKKIIRFTKRVIKVILIYPAYKTYKRNKLKQQRLKEERKIQEYINNRDNERKFTDFIYKHINLSPIVYPDYKDLLNNPPIADAYITGSDQVWNYEIQQTETKAFFLQFGNSQIKRIAYAPSIGHDSWPEERKQELKQYLSTFDSISLREESGVNICKEFGFNAFHVLDPTLLLTKDDYSVLLSNPSNKQINNSNPYIFIYSLNYSSPNDIEIDLIKKYAKDNALDIIVTPSTGYNVYSELFTDVNYIYSTIPQWIQYIMNSKLVITASFHGIVFSIIFHKNFMYTPLKGRHSHGNSRVMELLRNLNLENMIENCNKDLDEYINYNINWEEVNAKLEIMRKSSYSYLLNSLK